MLIEPFQPYRLPQLPTMPPPLSHERPFANAWTDRYSANAWPFLNAFAATAEIKTAHQYIIDAGQSVFELSPSTAPIGGLMSAVTIGSPNNISNVSLDLGLWRTEQNLRENADRNWPPIVDTATLQTGLDFAESIASTRFHSRPNDHHLALYARVMPGASGPVFQRPANPNRGALGEGVVMQGELAWLNEWAAITKQYNLAGLDPNVMLQNIIAFRDLLRKQGASQKLINSFNREIGRMSLDLRRRPPHL